MIAPAGSRDVTGAILAGGASRRLGGAPKGLLRMDEERIIDRIARAMRPLTRRLVLVSSHADAPRYLDDATVVSDERPGDGPLAAIATALRASRARVLVVAWDMPFVDRAVLEPLVAPAEGCDASVWERESGVEPLCACYEPSALPLLDAALDTGVRHARHIASILRLRRLRHVTGPHEHDPFTSVNTAQDLADVRNALPHTAATADQR